MQILLQKSAALLWSGTASSSAGIINWGRYYKAGQLLLQSEAIITKVVHYGRQLRQMEKGNRFSQLTPILISELLSDRHFTPRNSWEVGVLL